MKKISVPVAISLLCSAPSAWADAIRPGLWKISVEAQAADAPDWKPEPFERTQCLTENDAANPAPMILGLNSPGATGCDFPSKSYSGNRLSFEVTCAGTLGISGHGEVAYTATSLDGFLAIDMNAGEGEKVEMRNKIHASYQGACPAAGGGF